MIDKPDHFLRSGSLHEIAMGRQYIGLSLLLSTDAYELFGGIVWVATHDLDAPVLP